MKHHLAVIAILSKVVVVAVLHLNSRGVTVLSVRVVTVLHLSVKVVTVLHTGLKGGELLLLHDVTDEALVDRFIWILQARVLLRELGDKVIEWFSVDIITIRNDTIVTSIPCSC